MYCQGVIVCEGSINSPEKPQKSYHQRTTQSPSIHPRPTTIRETVQRQKDMASDYHGCACTPTETYYREN